MNVRRIPLDPPWLVIPTLVGIAIGLASVSIESWSIAFTYVGIALTSGAAAIGFDRWYEQRHPGGRLR